MRWKKKYRINKIEEKEKVSTQKNKKKNFPGLSGSSNPQTKDWGEHTILRWKKKYRRKKIEENKKVSTQNNKKKKTNPNKRLRYRWRHLERKK